VLAGARFTARRRAGPAGAIESRERDTFLRSHPSAAASLAIAIHQQGPSPLLGGSQARQERIRSMPRKPARDKAPRCGGGLALLGC
jgi:hypothetical protein